ncbi:MAG: TRAP transporter substrate-binding protein [Minwuia sp.]|uniref:TRAP transporter substrate-binding protein n=1 Tax=Minwuia sp. TaxID=2493630 RepID=UPI003A837CCF
MLRKLTLAAAALCVAGIAHAEPREMRYATAAPEATPWGKFLNETIADIHSRTDQLKVVPYFSSALGDEQTALRQTVRGRIDMSGQSGVATSLVAPSFELLSTAYLFENPEQSDCMFDNHIGPIFAEQMEGSGLVLLSWVEVGHSYTSSKEAIQKIEDIQGYKLRIPPTTATKFFYDELGANGVPMGVVDMVPALKTGQVNGITTSTVYGIAIGLPKLAPFTLVHHATHDVGTVTVSKKIWDQLGDEEKSALGVIDERVQELRVAIRGAETALLGQVAAAGAPVYELPAEEKARWKAAGERAAARLVEEIGGDAPEIWEKIQKAKASCS